MLKKKKNRDLNEKLSDTKKPINIPKISLTQISSDFSLINHIPEITNKVYLRSHSIKIKDHRDKKEKEKEEKK